MNVFLRVDINVVSIAMLLLVYFLSYKRLEKEDALNKLFTRVSVLIIHELFIETLTCIINRRPELWLIPVSSFLHILLFGLAPILTCYWYFLIRKIIFPNEEAIQRRHYLLFVPVGINLLMVMFSPITHMVFYIDAANVYHRGWLYLLSAMFSYGYIIFGLIIIFINRKKLPKQDFTVLMVFNVFSISGGLIQTLYYGPLLLWSCAGFSLVIAFIFIQERMVHLDVLTGAWDRGSFEYYIAQKLQYNLHKFGMIYVDIDRLKEINDNYGHMEGDEAIKTAIHIIRKEIRKNDIIVRLGGDEFLIILDCDVLEDLNITIDRVSKAFESYNNAGTKKYALECSFGADLFDPRYNNMDQFIHHVDTLMYQEKKRKKNLTV